MIFWVSKGIRELCSAMVANPHDWVQGQYRFTHKKHRDLSIWTASGVWFLTIGGNECLSLAEKFWLQAAIKLATARRLTTPEKS